MANLNELGVNNFEESESFAPLENGWYMAEIEKIDLKDSKSGGKYVNIGFKIISSKGSGRYVWEIYNIVNANPIAENIGRSTLDRVAVACGFQSKTLTDTDHLSSKQLEINVIIDKNGDNKVKSYRPLGNVAPIPSFVSPPPAFQMSPPSKPSGAVFPWEKSKAKKQESNDNDLAF